MLHIHTIIKLCIIISFDYICIKIIFKIKRFAFLDKSKKIQLFKHFLFGPY